MFKILQEKGNDNNFCLTASISSSHEASKPDIGVFQNASLFLFADSVMTGS
jgi:hypothetical protein